MESKGKPSPLKSENMCQVCNQHRIMRGGDVLTWMTRPNNPDKGVGIILDAHAQCVGPYLLKNPEEMIGPVMHDPNQIDLMEALKESLRQEKVIPLVIAEAADR